MYLSCGLAWYSLSRCAKNMVNLDRVHPFLHFKPRRNQTVCLGWIEVTGFDAACKADLCSFQEDRVSCSRSPQKDGDK